MSLIYEPKGKAREYSALALNIYSGCDHGCFYCYVPQVMKFVNGYKHEDVKLKANYIEQLKKDAKKFSNTDKQVLFSFTTDPYSHFNDKHKLTRQALEILLENKIPVSILSKGGKRILQDIDLFKKYGEHIKIGMTLTYVDEKQSLQSETGAAIPLERFLVLNHLKENGIKTWVSLEPVMDVRQTLQIIKLTHSYVDHYKVGKLNHVNNTTDWHKFLVDSVTLLRELDKKFYVKKDLASYQKDFYLSPDETDMDLLAVKGWKKNEFATLAL